MTVYISCAPANNQRVAALYNLLQQDGYEPWWGEADLLPGDNRNLVTTRTLGAAHAFILCLSKAYNNPGLHHRELKEAQEQVNLRPDGAHFIIPLLLEDCTIPISVEKFIYLKYFENDTMGYQKLRRTLSGLTNHLTAQITSGGNSENNPSQQPLSTNPTNGAKLTNEQLMILADKLLTCPSMKTPSSRRSIVDLLPEVIQANYNPGSNGRTDVASLLQQCRVVENGLKELISTVRWYDGGTIPFAELERYLKSQNIVI